VNIGSRQDGRDRGRNVADVAYDAEAIGSAIEKQVAAARFECDPIYGDGQAGARIADLLAEVPLGVEKRLTY
jgi:hypothetical protein